MWFLCCMAKTFKSWDVDQLVLLPPSIQELVPAGHLAHFVRDMVRDSLDLSAILKTYTEDRGFPDADRRTGAGHRGRALAGGGHSQRCA